MIFFSASSLTAMEAWVVGCLVFVFLALIEYGAVLKVMSSTQEKTDQGPGRCNPFFKKSISGAILCLILLRPYLPSRWLPISDFPPDLKAFSIVEKVISDYHEPVHGHREVPERSTFSKNFKMQFFKDISNSFHRVTRYGLKPLQFFSFKNISRGIQSFSQRLAGKLINCQNFCIKASQTNIY